MWRLRPGGWRSELVLGGLFAGALALLWLLTGNRLRDLPEWFRESLHVVSGYTSAMALEGRGRGWDYAVAGALVAVGAVAVGLEARRVGRARGVALCLVAAAFAFAYFKEGFVRHDGHVNYFFAAIAVGAIAFAGRGRVQQVVVLVLAAGAVLAIVRTPDHELSNLYRPGTTASAALDQIRTVADGSDRRKAAAAAKDAIRRYAAVDAATLRAVRGHRVDVVPYETSVVWGYGLRWRPEPVLQWHVAYDSHLDEVNARALVERGAERVLRHVDWPALDGKNPHHEAPATFLALLCNYRDVHVAAAWEVLARVAPRCGAPRLLSTTEARTGQALRVPRAPTRQDVVLARIHLARPLLQGLQLTAFKQLDLPQMTLDGERYRFVSTDGPLVLRLPRSAGIAPTRGGSVDYSTMSLRHVPSPFRVDFYAMRIAGSGKAAPAGDASLVGDRALRIDGRTVPITPGAVDTYLDQTTRYGGDAIAQGWAADATHKRPAARILAFAGDRLVASRRPTVDRPDIARGLGAPRVTRSGYFLRFAARDTALGVRIFGVAGGRASEATYPRTYAWAGGTAGAPSGSLAGGRELRVGGRTIPIVAGAVTAFVDTAARVGQDATIYGWAADLRRRRPATRLFVFSGRRLVAAVTPKVRRTDIVGTYHAPTLERSGYRAAFPAYEAASGIRVFAVADGRASEAAYPKDYRWSRGR